MLMSRNYIVDRYRKSAGGKAPCKQLAVKAAGKNAAVPGGVKKTHR